MMLARLEVQAGWHPRQNCPVQAQVPVSNDVNLESLILINAETGNAVTIQATREGEADSVTISWIVEALDAEQSQVYELQIGQQIPELSGGVNLDDAKDGLLQISVGGEQFTTYNFGRTIIRPYLYPVFASDGVGITRDWPMVPDAVGDTTDHVHHRGIWTAHGEVNGNVDNWGEKEGHGWQIHRGFKNQFSGPVLGGFTQSLDWTDGNKKVNMTETRRMTFYDVPGSIRLFDYTVSLHASHGAVLLADTKEAGLLSVRVATSMDAKNENGGRIQNGFGGLQEQETWGKRAPWCHYDGPINEQWYGISLMDHPDNPRHPSHWHVRNYGLMTANCFGLHDFTRDPNQRWDLTIPAGETRTWQYRVLIHLGDAGQGQPANYYHDFAHPPTISIL
ncbi:MAG: PmoA family protein [Chloroflexota bacterium]